MVDRWETNWGQILQNILPVNFSNQLNMVYLFVFQIWYRFYEYGVKYKLPLMESLCDNFVNFAEYVEKIKHHCFA